MANLTSSGGGLKTFLAISICDRVQRPGADAAHQEGGAELGLAAGRVLDVAEGAVEGQDPGRGAGVDHAGDRVVPEVLLGADPVGLGVLGVGRVLHHPVAGVAAADPGRLHPPRGGEVGGAEAHPLHARAGGGDLLQVDDALRRLEDRVDQDRAVEAGLGLELGEQAVDVVDVPGALDLGHHHDLELVADLADQRGQVVEHPGALQRVDPRPERGLAEVGLGRGLDQAGARRLLAVDRDRVLEVAEQDVGLLRDGGRLGDHLLVREVEEVDHPRRLDGDLAQRLGGADRQRLEEVSGVSQAAPKVVRCLGCRPRGGGCEI